MSSLSIRGSVCIVALVGLLVPKILIEIPYVEPAPQMAPIPVVETPPFVPRTLLFVGDIFLGRSVEKRALEFGDEYSFLGTSALIQEADIAIGNFEGSVPQIHVPTPSMGFVFSIHERFLPIVRSAGFDILSLANNHAFDYGVLGYEHSKERCSGAGLICVGHPREVGTQSTTSVMLDDTEVGIVFLHALVPIDEAMLDHAVDSLESHDLRVAYIHWGNEYEHTHSGAQEKLAHHLIDSGIDVVIGHHPHVVQDIELYKGKPIFFSLGNFIFDQYFSPDVMEHLGVQIKIEERSFDYSIIPFESSSTRSQPKIMEGETREIFMQNLVVKNETTTLLATTEPLFSIPR